MLRFTPFPLIRRRQFPPSSSPRKAIPYYNNYSFKPTGTLPWSFHYNHHRYHQAQPNYSSRHHHHHHSQTTSDEYGKINSPFSDDETYRGARQYFDHHVNMCEKAIGRLSQDEIERMEVLMGDGVLIPLSVKTLDQLKEFIRVEYPKHEKETKEAESFNLKFHQELEKLANKKKNNDDEIVDYPLTTRQLETLLFPPKSKCTSKKIISKTSSELRTTKSNKSKKKNKMKKNFSKVPFNPNYFLSKRQFRSILQNERNSSRNALLTRFSRIKKHLEVNTAKLEKRNAKMSSHEEAFSLVQDKKRKKLANSIERKLSQRFKSQLRKQKQQSSHTTSILLQKQQKRFDKKLGQIVLRHQQKQKEKNNKAQKSPPPRSLVTRSHHNETLDSLRKTISQHFLSRLARERKMYTESLQQLKRQLLRQSSLTRTKIGKFELRLNQVEKEKRMKERRAVAELKKKKLKEDRKLKNTLKKILGKEDEKSVITKNKKKNNSTTTLPVHHQLTLEEEEIKPEDVLVEENNNNNETVENQQQEQPEENNESGKELVSFQGSSSSPKMKKDDDDDWRFWAKKVVRRHHSKKLSKSYKKVHKIRLNKQHLFRDMINRRAFANYRSSIGLGSNDPNFKKMSSEKWEKVEAAFRRFNKFSHNERMKFLDPKREDPPIFLDFTGIHNPENYSKKLVSQVTNRGRRGKLEDFALWSHAQLYRRPRKFMIPFIQRALEIEKKMKKKRRSSTTATTN